LLALAVLAVSVDFPPDVDGDGDVPFCGVPDPVGAGDGGFPSGGAD